MESRLITRPIHRRLLLDRFIVLACDGPDPDDDSQWELVPTDEVPAWLRDEEIMGAIADGHTLAQRPELSATWFRVERVLDS